MLVILFSNKSIKKSILQIIYNVLYRALIIPIQGRNPMKISVWLLAVSLSLFLAACGGGSSSGGSEQQLKDLSFCVAELLEERAIASPSGGADIVFKDYTFTNLCGETVNLSIGSLTTSSIGTLPLADGESYSQTSAVLPLKYIACRPPSVGIDIDADAPLIQFVVARVG